MVFPKVKKTSTYLCSWFNVGLIVIRGKLKEKERENEGRRERKDREPWTLMMTRVKHKRHNNY